MHSLVLKTSWSAEYKRKQHRVSSRMNNRFNQ